MSYECKSSLHRTIDIDVNGEYRTEFDEEAGIDWTAGEPTLFVDNNNINFGLTQRQFERDVQLLFESSAATFTENAQVNYRNIDGQALAGLTDTFSLTVSGNG
jgi:hypothetical protein